LLLAVALVVTRLRRLAVALVIALLRLPVALVVTGWLAITLVVAGLLLAVALVVTSGGLPVTALLVVAGLLLAVALVVTLLRLPVALVVTGLLTIAALLVVAGLLTVARLLAVAALLVVAGLLLAVAVVVVLALALAVALVVAVLPLLVVRISLGVVAWWLAHGSVSCGTRLCRPSVNVGVDGRADSKLSRVQRLRALQGDYDVTICVPPLLGEMLLNAIGEEVGHPSLIAGEPIVIGRAQLHNVVVTSEQPSPGKLPDLQLGFPLQSLGDLLRNDLSAENARKAITDDAFESALKALHEAHGKIPPRVRLLATIVSGPTSQDTAQFPSGPTPCRSRSSARASLLQPTGQRGSFQ
jgi:hypothetical protein